MEAHQLQPIIESLIFAAEEPLTEQGIVGIMEADGVGREAVREAINAIRASWNDDPSRGLMLADIAGGYQFRTKETLAEWIRRMNASRPAKLSLAAMETLAIVAYRQPLVRSEIEQVRGVDSGGVIKKLLEKNLIRIVGKRDEPGQPLIYGTTREFLTLFGLNSLKDLPPLADLRELAERHLAGSAGKTDAPVAECGDDEEPTEVIEDGDDEEPTEIIARLHEDEENDESALANLEYSLKSVRRLERAIFPKDAPHDAAGNEGDTHAATEGDTTWKEGAAPSADPAAAIEADAPQSTDSSGE